MSEAVEKLASGRGGPVAPRRRWSDAEKRRIVTESYQPGVSVSVVARRNDVNANLVFTWRRRFREQADGAGGLVPVIVEPLPLDTAAGDAPAAGRMEIALADGLAGDCRPGGGRFGAGPGSRGSGAAMIPVPGGVRVWLATGVTDMRRGMNTLALQVQEDLGRDPHAGDLYVFRGRRGDLVKCLWHDGVGISLYAKRLERGRFQWPVTSGGTVSISAAQLGYLLEGIDWRNPVRSWRPSRAG